MALKESKQKAKFDKENCRRVGLKLNIHTDADILTQLDKQESMQGYIRRLIREDIAHSEEQKNEGE